jgi:hypothetical protein
MDGARRRNVPWIWSRCMLMFLDITIAITLTELEASQSRLQFSLPTLGLHDNASTVPAAIYSVSPIPA